VAQWTRYYVINQVSHCYATNKQATIEEPLETVFYVRSDPSLCNENQRDIPKPLKESKVITLPKPGKDPKFAQNLRSTGILSTTGKLFEKVISKIVQRHIEERGLLNPSQFVFRTRHSTTFQCMRLTDHATLNLNNNMSTGRCSWILKSLW
jgi:hypothetical protein